MFMEPQVTEKMSWDVIECDEGTFVYPGGTFPASGYIANHGKGTVIYEIYGFGARLSANGYLDATDWGVYDTPEEAINDLDTMYGDDSEEWEEAMKSLR
jgi:hypothetical protein